MKKAPHSLSASLVAVSVFFVAAIGLVSMSHVSSAADPLFSATFGSTFGSGSCEIDLNITFDQAPGSYLVTLTNSNGTVLGTKSNAKNTAGYQYEPIELVSGAAVSSDGAFTATLKDSNGTVVATGDFSVGMGPGGGGMTLCIGTPGSTTTTTTPTSTTTTSTTTTTTTPTSTTTTTTAPTSVVAPTNSAVPALPAQALPAQALAKPAVPLTAQPTFTG